MSVQRTFAVVEHLARRGPSSLRGLARDLDLPIGSAHRLVAALAAEGIVERTTGDEWRLTYRLLSIVGHQLGRSGLPALARPVLEELADKSGQTAFLAARSGQDVVYLDKVQSEAQVQLYIELGTRRPMHCTALGKVILAFVPAAQREDFLASAALDALTDHTITDPVVLRRELEAIRAQGYATDKQEVVAGVSCLAAPLIDHAGGVVGAISIAGTDPRVRDEDTGLVELVTGGGVAVSQRLGYPTPARDHP